jgi:hypothetical protein
VKKRGIFSIERNYGAFNRDTLICFLRNILHLKKKIHNFFYLWNINTQSCVITSINIPIENMPRFFTFWMMTCIWCFQCVVFEYLIKRKCVWKVGHKTSLKLWWRISLNVLSWQDSETRPGEFVIFMLSITIEKENFEVNCLYKTRWDLMLFMCQSFQQHFAEF